MMLRSLVNEVVSRRMWPIPLVAILIAVAAPLLFMKSPGATPASNVAPPAAEKGDLPTGAERLVSTSDKDATSGKKNTRKGRDPFAPAVKPKKPEAAAAASAATPAPAAAAAGTSANPVPVVIQNSDGSSSTMSVPSTRTTASAPKKSSTTKRKKATTSTKKATATKAATSATGPALAYVDVRFGERKDTYLRYRVPRLQTFRAGGRIAAMFVHYSTKRDVAVFAVAPSTKVKGDVGCREIKGVCRYVDIPAGKYVRLVLKDLKGRLISRRLDVVSVRHIRGAEDTTPRETALDTATCLLKGLLKLVPSVPSITTDACA